VSPTLRFGKMLCVVAFVVTLFACASSKQVKISQELSDSADAPYKNILVVALFESYDGRRYLEMEVVNELSRRGTEAVRSTSMMDSRTPVNRETFLAMVEKIGADAVLLTQLTSHDAVVSQKDARPEATYNYWPTYYYNVFSVELTEYVEPPRQEAEHSLILATQLFSVASREPVWGMESISVIIEKQEDGLNQKVYVQEAQAIVGAMSRGGVIAPK
jgi:hypothetical protein